MNEPEDEDKNSDDFTEFELGKSIVDYRQTGSSFVGVGDRR